MTSIRDLENKAADYDRMRQERDELAAQVEVMRDALAHAKDQLEEWELRIEREWGDGRDLDEIEADGELSDATIIVRKALSATPSAALREIQARTLDKAADRHWRSAMDKCKRDRVNPADRNDMFYGIALLRNEAAAIRKGE